MGESADTPEHPGELITREELALAARNHGMPLELLRHPVTPIGAHYLLTHFDVPFIDPASWRLTVGGRVARPLSLDLDDVRSRPAVTRRVTLECAGNGRARLARRRLSQPWLWEAVGTGEWTGTPLRGVLTEAGLADDALEVVFTGADRGVQGGIAHAYERSLRIDDALADEVLLVYALNGQPLPPQHGAPLRLLVPGWYGMASVKWLERITAVDAPFEGYQQAHAYRHRTHADIPGVPLSRIAPRALMVPPGVPEFWSRRRLLPAGTHVLEGRAWSGWGPITSVTVSTDGGQTWHTAAVEERPGPAAWHRWTASWEARETGDYELCCRAEDAAGNIQPVQPPWNPDGYAVNDVHRVAVTVSADA